MRTDELDYGLPDDRIAQRPVEPRDAARLLVDVGGPVEHRRVADLAELVGPGDLIVVNRSRVLHARLRARRPSGGAAEVLLLEPDAGGGWSALVRPSRKIEPGVELDAGELTIRVQERLEEGLRRVRLVRCGAELDGEDVDGVLRAVGEVPLPPYLTEGVDDPERYQTVYASSPGSVAAPTAGLHLTPELIEACTRRGARVAEVELHVGLGTFRPVTADDTDDHVMHTERFHVPDSTAAALSEAERVLAVGTTTVRALESWARGMEGRTDLYLQPGDEIKVVDLLLTNFHQPRSTLLLLVEAIIGPRWRELYALALDEGYRFLSFGDAMIIAAGPRR